MKITFYTLAACLFLSFLSCADDKDEAAEIQKEIAGTWQLISVTADGADADISSYPDFIRFQANSIFLSYREATEVKERGGWSYTGEMLNISLYLPAAYYPLKIDAQNLSLKRLDFNTEGALSTSILEYRRTDDSKIPE
jgi:hypothetical protein